MKRKLTLGLAAAIGLFSLTACSSTKAADAPKKDKPVTIEYWHVNADTQGGKTVSELVDDYNKSQDKVKVVAKFNPICIKA